MTDSTKPTISLETLAANCDRRSRLWTSPDGAKQRLYLNDCEGAYIWLDADGDLIGTTPRKLSRVEDRRVWAPWERAARALGRRLYA